MNRTFIRHPSQEDEEEFIALATQSASFHRPWMAPPTDHEGFRGYLESLGGERKVGFLVCLRESEKIAGMVNLNEITRGALQSAYLGYWIGSSYAGQGYMTEGLGRVIGVAFQELGLHRLEANIQPGNAKSIGLVKRLGFTREGFSRRYLVVDGDWRDHERWAILSEDWAEQRSRSAAHGR